MMSIGAKSKTKTTIAANTKPPTSRLAMERRCRAVLTASSWSMGSKMSLRTYRSDESHRTIWGIDGGIMIKITINILKITGITTSLRINIFKNGSILSLTTSLKDMISRIGACKIQITCNMTRCKAITKCLNLLNLSSKCCLKWWCLGRTSSWWSLTTSNHSSWWSIRCSHRLNCKIRCLCLGSRLKEFTLHNKWLRTQTKRGIMRMSFISSNSRSMSSKIWSSHRSSRRKVIWMIIITMDRLTTSLRGRCQIIGRWTTPSMGLPTTHTMSALKSKR